MEHALTYRAIAGGDVDVMDVFSTDGQLERLRLQILQDDKRFFPDYSAVLLARRDMAERFPRTWARLREAFEGALDDQRMAKLNAMADLDGKSVAEVAAAFLGTAPPDPRRRPGALSEIFALTLDHLLLVLISLAAAVVLGIPMGIAAARFRRTGQIELGAIGMLQTVPALALLVFMIPLFGIGTWPLLKALPLLTLALLTGGLVRAVLGDGESAQHLARTGIQPHAFQEWPAKGFDSPRAHQPALGKMKIADHQVFPDREVREQVELLVNHPDAQPLRVQRAGATG